MAWRVAADVRSFTCSKSNGRSFKIARCLTADECMLFEDLVETNLLAVVFQDDARAPALPHEVPETVLQHGLRDGLRRFPRLRSVSRIEALKTDRLSGVLRPLVRPSRLQP